MINADLASSLHAWLVQERHNFRYLYYVRVRTFPAVYSLVDLAVVWTVKCAELWLAILYRVFWWNVCGMSRSRLLFEWLLNCRASFISVVLEIWPRSPTGLQYTCWSNYLLEMKYTAMVELIFAGLWIFSKGHWGEQIMPLLENMPKIKILTVLLKFLQTNTHARTCYVMLPGSLHWGKVIVRRQCLRKLLTCIVP